MWVQTEPVAGATRDLPIVRDLDGRFYVRHYRGGCSSAPSSPTASRAPTASIPADFAFGEFDPDLAHFELPLAKARGACRR